MKINFIKILIKPLFFKNVLISVLKLFLLFLPAILAANFIGVTGWVFKITVSAALVALNGYLWMVCQEEIEREDNTKLPETGFIDALFVGIKGLIFSLLFVSLFITGLFILQLLSNYLPDFKNSVFIAEAVLSAFWFFMIYPIAMGIFAQKFNSAEALDFSTIFQIIGNSWLSYLVAFIYMAVYIFILGGICWAILTITGYSFSYFTIGFFVLYAIIVYFLLYSRVFKQVRTEFEGHI
jgi:hypothetical protein